MRLNKYIVACGVCSRRKADVLIENGDIAINGNVVTTLGVKVDIETDTVFYLDKQLKLNTLLEYYMLNKPTQVMSTCEDPQGRKTVLNMIDTKSRLYPVGRLDYESSGLLIISNDGDLTNRVTHPSFEMEKEYWATIKGVLDSSALEKLQNGVFIDGYKTHVATVETINEGKGHSVVKFIIHEGRNRQIRNMVKAVGSHVYALERVRLGKLTLEGLALGEHRALTSAEVDYLKGK